MRPVRLPAAVVRSPAPRGGLPHTAVRFPSWSLRPGVHRVWPSATQAMPPEFAQQMQQLFARQMAVAFLHHCARLDAPVSLVNRRIEALESAVSQGSADAPATAAQASADARALEAEFILEP